MQSLKIGLLLGFIFACNAIPLGGDYQSTRPDTEAETRIIIPPELPPHHFEMLKEKSDNISSDKDSTPLNFLRLPESLFQNMNSSMQPAVLAIEGSKQIPIYITIPIYIYPSYHAQQGPDGAVITTTPLRQLIDPAGDEKINLNPEDVKAALKELLVDTFKENTEPSVDRKKRVNRQKQRKTYRD